MDKDASTPESGETSAAENENSEESKSQSQEEAQKTGLLNALREERAKRQELAEKLKGYEAKEQERAAQLGKKKEEKLKEEGKFQEILAEKEGMITSLSEVSEQLKTKVEAYETTINGLVDKSLESLQKDDRELVETLLDGKTPEKKLETLPALLKKFQSPQNFNKNPESSKDSLVDKKEKAAQLAQSGKLGAALNMLMKK